MKTVKDYTENELLNLNDDEVPQLIELQCAIDGVPILPPMPIMPMQPNTPPDTLTYNVGCFYFENKEAAERVILAIMAESRLDIGYNYQDNDYTDRVKGYVTDDVQITQKGYMSEEQYAALKTERVQYKKAKEAYDELSTAYSDALTAREDSNAKITNAIKQAANNRYKREDSLAKYDHYLVLADGDKSIAIKFFNQSYSHLFDYLPSEIRGTEAQCAEAPKESNE